jgi:hypothetical protein
MTLRRTALALLVSLALGVAACGQQADTVRPGSPGTTKPGDTATSTTLPSPTGTPTFGGDAGSLLVTPQPGTIKPHPIPWQDSKPGADGRRVRIYFTSGVAPCSVLDHVKVSYLDDRVIVTLYEGSDARAKTQMCIDLAQYKMVDVRLDQPLGKREVGDGAPR